MLEQKFPCSPWKTISEQIINNHAGACVGSHTTAGGYGMKASAACGVPMKEQAFGTRCDLWVTHTGGVCSEMTVVYGKDSHWISS